MIFRLMLLSLIFICLSHEKALAHEKAHQCVNELATDQNAEALAVLKFIESNKKNMIQALPAKASKTLESRIESLSVKIKALAAKKLNATEAQFYRSWFISILQLQARTEGQTNSPKEAEALLIQTKLLSSVLSRHELSAGSRARLEKLSNHLISLENAQDSIYYYELQQHLERYFDFTELVNCK